MSKSSNFFNYATIGFEIFAMFCSGVNILKAFENIQKNKADSKASSNTKKK